MTVFSKLLICTTIANAVFLALDDIPVDFTWKEYLFSKINPRVFKVVYDANMVCL